MHCGYFDTTRNDNHSSFVTPTLVGGRRPLPCQIFAESDPSPVRNWSYRRVTSISYAFGRWRFGRVIFARRIVTVSRRAEPLAVLTTAQWTFGRRQSHGLSVIAELLVQIFSRLPALADCSRGPCSVRQTASITSVVSLPLPLAACIMASGFWNCQ